MLRILAIIILAAASAFAQNTGMQNAQSYTLPNGGSQGSQLPQAKSVKTFIGEHQRSVKSTISLDTPVITVSGLCDSQVPTNRVSKASCAIMTLACTHILTV